MKSIFHALNRLKVFRGLTEQEFAWVLYDVGNSAFTMLSCSLIPIWFKSLAIGTAPGQINSHQATAYYSIAVAVVTVIVALLGPIFGVLADHKDKKKVLFTTAAALGIFGCMLGYTLICDEMKDEDLCKLVYRLGYIEGLPVVTHPGIISPRDFIDEVVYKRLPNPFMPDAPQRIATDTSQKVGIRFGETIKSYAAVGDLSNLIAIPLAIAGWLRYLLGVDDEGNKIEISSDPLLPELRKQLESIEFGKPYSYTGQLGPILSNPVATLSGSDLLL